MFKTLRRIADALEQRNELAKLQIRTTNATNELLLRLAKDLDPGPARERSQELLERLTGQLVERLEEAAKTPVRVEVDGAQVEVETHRPQRGLMVGDTPVRIGDAA